MRLTSRSWLGEILLNTTKNNVQRLDSITGYTLDKSLLSNEKRWLKKTLTFEQSGPNLERAGQHSHEHSLFIALLFAGFLGFMNKRAIVLELRPS